MSGKPGIVVEARPFIDILKNTKSAKFLNERTDGWISLSLVWKEQPLCLRSTLNLDICD